MSHFDVGDFLTNATVDIPDSHAIDFSVRNNVMLNGLSGGVLLVTGVVDTSTSVSEVLSLSLLPFNNFLIPSTLQAVLNNVKKKPPIITLNTLKTSIALPNPPANGKVIKLGTKNTGSHFANNIAPGFNILYIASPSFSLLIVFSNNIAVNNDPHPAKLDGNGIEYLVKSDRNCISSNIKIVVASIVFCLLLFSIDDGLEEVAGLALAYREVAVYLLTGAFDANCNGGEFL